MFEIRDAHLCQFFSISILVQIGVQPPSPPNLLSYILEIYFEHLWGQLYPIYPNFGHKNLLLALICLLKMWTRLLIKAK